MTLLDNLRGSLRSLTSNLMRTLLTMLGMIIGVAAVIAMISIGSGAQAAVSKQIDSLGTNLLSVNTFRFFFGGVAQSAASSVTLTYSDATAIAALKPYVVGVAPQAGKNVQITAGNQNTNTSLTGTTPNYATVYAWSMGEGRFFNQQEVDTSANVAVIGTTTATSLFGTADPLGQQININGISFVVIGVTATKAQAGPQDQNDHIWVPITTAHYRLIGGPTLDLSAVQSIGVEVASPAAATIAQSEIQALLMQRHHITDPANSDFRILNQAQLLATRSSVVGTFTILLASVAAASLLVGGIGIMNIMLVTVTERTREIGIRKAIGASRQAIMTQFVLEALMLSLVGGLIGIIFGPAVSQIYGHLVNTPTQLTLPPIFLAAGVSIAIGLFFGIYPAQRASKLDPIQALRSE